jgi:hypothetical protein
MPTSRPALTLTPPAAVRPGEDLAALAAEINAAHEAGTDATRKGLEHFRRAGEALLRAKESCIAAHVPWLAWLAANVCFDPRTARNYMRLALYWDKISGSLAPVSNTGLVGALKLISQAEEKGPRLDALPDGGITVPAESLVRADGLPASPREPILRQADCIEFLTALPEDSIDLIFGSPPYERARLYLEGGEDMGIARDTREWVAWMVDVYRAALRCCKGLVAFVVEGQTKDYSWSAAPALLMAALVEAGVTLRKPPLYKRVGIPGSGGPDWLRNDYELIICATRGGKLPWSDNTACGHPPKYEAGGVPSHRQADGSRVNGLMAYASPEECANVGSHRAQRQAGRVYIPPEKSNPGNIVDCGVVGGSNMGDRLCHQNEAPFPESLAEFFVRSFCPPGGVVCDPFLGSGTTGAAAARWHRRFVGCDLRASQVKLSRARIARAQPMLPFVEA